MAVTTTDDTEPTVQTAIVAIRVPNGAEGDLTREAERRLSRIDGVDEASVDGLRGLEPRLSATVATVEVAIRTEDAVADLRDGLSAGAGVEDVALAER